MLAKAIKDGKSIAQSNFQFQWVVGSKTSEDALEKSKKFSIENIADKIEIPFLITHGENDKIIPVGLNSFIFSEDTSKGQISQ